MRTFLLIALVTGCGTPGGSVERVEICDNLRDDDGDALVDCSDPDCVGSCPENCVDALDNDGDGAVDCADAECDGLCPEDCTDGRDNDGDLQVDCADVDCLGLCPEDCSDGVDNDGDGLFDCVDPDCAAPTCPELCSDGADNDGDGLVDCDDPSCDGDCPERCDDGRDNDGDGDIDCADPDCDGACPEQCTDGRDNDGDGIFDCADPDCSGSCDLDGDGYLDAAGGGLDCDDTDPGVHPGASERCSGRDDDCDGLVDEDDPSLDPATLLDVLPDEDEDGYGDPTQPLGQGCTAPSGAVLVGGDCDDTDNTRNPEVDEVCDGVDDDCDGLVDHADPDLDPALLRTWYVDVDGDGFGDPLGALEACDPPPGYVGNDSDCHVFDPELTLIRDWWPDADGDGYGAGVPLSACARPSGYSGSDADCDDTDPTLSPDTRWHADADLDGYGDPDTWVPSCTSIYGHLRDDSDCDDADWRLNPTTVWQLDADGDGHGSPVATVTGCDPPDGAPTADDCDDTDADTYPGAPELCDHRDNDCDLQVDEDADAPRWFLDLDADGAGTRFVSVVSCDPPPWPAATEQYDCDDMDPVRNPHDDDGDGVTSCDGDCDDADPLTYIGAPELCDGVDNDCNAAVDDDVATVRWYADADLDGAGDPDLYEDRCDPPPWPFARAPDDCDDADPALNALDADADGYTSCAGDCDDTDPGWFPGAPDPVGDGLDTSCDGLDGPSWLEDFERSGRVGPLPALLGWPWLGAGDRPWTRTETSSVEGMAAQSDDIEDGQVSITVLPVRQEVDGTLEFWRRVSSETCCDILEVQVDGLVEGTWSGDVPWGRVVLPLTAGDHVVAFVYRKDFSLSVGWDRAWIDDVHLVGGLPF